MKVLIFHDRIPEQPRKDELDVLNQVEAVSAALKTLGYDPGVVPFDFDVHRIRRELHRVQPEIIFNLVESVEGQDRLIYLAPALFNALGFAYTGSSAEAIFSTTNKVFAKTLMRSAGISTPDWFTLSSPPGDSEIRGRRMIIKSVWEHASVGLDDASVFSPSSGQEVFNRLAGRKKELFAEMYVEGREFNLSVLAAQKGPEVLSPAEIRFVGYEEGKPRMVGYTAKWDEGSFEYENTARKIGRAHV